MPVGRLRVKLKSYDHRVIDEAAAKILDTAIATGAKIVGPIPLPTKRSIFPVLESPFKHKDAQEDFASLSARDITEAVKRGIRELVIHYGTGYEEKIEAYRQYLEK